MAASVRKKMFLHCSKRGASKAWSAYFLAAAVAIHVAAAVCSAEKCVGQEQGAEASRAKILPQGDLEELKQILYSQQKQLQHLESLMNLLHASVDQVRDQILSNACVSSSSSLVTKSAASHSTGINPSPGSQATAGNELRSEGPPPCPSMESKQSVFHPSTDKEIASDLYQAASQDAFMLAPRERDATDSSKYGYNGAVTVARYKPAWSEHFQFLAAVKVKEQVSCLHILSRDGDDGSIRYVAVGDVTGRVYLFNSLGDLLLDFMTHSPASVTVMQSISLRKNETLLVTGHSNGDVLAHKIRETGYYGSSSGDGWHKLFMEFLHPFLHASPTSAVSGAPSSASRTAFPDSSAEASHEELQKTALITNLEIYRVGRMRYLLVSDKAGRISVFRDNGTLYGVAESPSRPLAFLRSMSTQKMLFLTESGAASLDLRTMAVRSSPCSGLDGSTVILYAFDAVVRSKAYGVTAAGELIHVVLSGDTLHFECHTRGPKRKLEIEPPLALHGFKGYLLAATMHEVIVCNTTMQYGFGPASIRVAGPRPIFRAPIEDVVTISLNMQISKSEFPVLAGDRERLVVLGFGHGYVGIFRSTLPVYKPLDFSAKLWSSPIIISVVVLMGVWFFFGRKKDLGLASFPEAPIYGAIGSSVSGISKCESVRAGYGESRDRLEDSRQYVSPTRTFTASRSSYGTGSLNFRASSVEPAPYSSRRDTAFSSNELVGD